MKRIIGWLMIFAFSVITLDYSTVHADTIPKKGDFLVFLSRECYSPTLMAL